MKLLKKSERGYTLVEIVAALAILAIVGIPLSRFFINSFSHQRRSTENAQAAKVAEYYAEKLKNGEFQIQVESVTNPGTYELAPIPGVAELEEEVTSTIYTENFKPIDFPNQRRYKLILEMKRKSAEIGSITSTPDSFELGTVAIEDNIAFTHNPESCTVTNISEGDIKKALITIPSTIVSNTLLISSESNADWNIFINNKSSARIYIYIKSKNEGKVAVIGTSNTVGNFKTFDLQKNEATKGSNYELYDVTIKVYAQKGEEDTDYSNLMSTITTSFRKETVD